MNILEEFWYGNIEPAEEQLSHAKHVFRAAEPDRYGACTGSGVHKCDYHIAHQPQF